LNMKKLNKKGLKRERLIPHSRTFSRKSRYRRDEKVQLVKTLSQGSSKIYHNL
jgi:hypothetical protein